jgi:hypothetical protein
MKNSNASICGFASIEEILLALKKGENVFTINESNSKPQDTYIENGCLVAGECYLILEHYFRMDYYTSNPNYIYNYMEVDLFSEDERLASELVKEINLQVEYILKNTFLFKR